MRGKALTPFILSELEVHTGGASVRANRVLASSNARVATHVARALAAHTRAV